MQHVKEKRIHIEFANFETSKISMQRLTPYPFRKGCRKFIASLQSHVCLKELLSIACLLADFVCFLTSDHS